MSPDSLGIYNNQCNIKRCQIYICLFRIKLNVVFAQLSGHFISKVLQTYKKNNVIKHCQIHSYLFWVKLNTLLVPLTSNKRQKVGRFISQCTKTNVIKRCQIHVRLFQIKPNALTGYFERIVKCARRNAISLCRNGATSTISPVSLGWHHQF